MRLHRGTNRRSPELDRDLIGHQLALAGVFKEGFANLRPGVDGTKHIAAGAMKKAWDCAQRFALRPFAAPRRAKEDERYCISCEIGLYRLRSRSEQRKAESQA